MFSFIYKIEKTSVGRTRESRLSGFEQLSFFVLFFVSFSIETEPNA